MDTWGTRLMANLPGKPNSKAQLLMQVTAAKLILDRARIGGDQLKIDLAENTLNYLLDKLYAVADE